MIPVDLLISEIKKRVLLLHLLLALLVLVSGCAGKLKWSTHSKIVYSAVVAAQIGDGLTTIHNLEDPENKICENWQWKYFGKERPSAERIWVTKTMELGVCWLIADQIGNETWRNAFLWGIAGLLAYCAVSNDCRGIGFSWSY